MNRLEKEVFVEALPSLQKRLQEELPTTPIKVQIANGLATPHNPFAPKLSSAYHFRVIVQTNWARCMFIPYIRPCHAGPLGVGAVFASGWANNKTSTIVSEWVRDIHTKKAMAVAKERIAPLKEELMAAAWHPTRVQRWLEMAGWEFLETAAA